MADDCSAKVLVWSPRACLDPGDPWGVAACAGDHSSGRHSGPLVMGGTELPGGGTSTIGWEEDDRRTFRGEHPPELCDESRCILPAGHPRSHAY